MFRCSGLYSRGQNRRIAAARFPGSRSSVWISFLLFAAALPGAFASLANAAEETALPASAPVNPNATVEARALLKFFYDIGGKHTLTGQHNTPSQINAYSQRAFDLTGKYPAVFGQDLGFAGGSDKDSVLARATLLEEIKLQHQRGAVIALTWHAVCPTDDEPVTFRDSVQHKLSDFEWEELITPGTRLNERWKVQVDEIAGFLRQLREAHIPVLWRPYHEVHGNWFWWGGRPGPRGSVALYRMMYERFVNHHHLDNLLWVWNGAPPGEKDPQGTNFYPGNGYADILSIDVYGPFAQRAYEQVLQVAQGKPIALGEVGTAPSAEILRNQPRWIYFLIWSEFIEFSNPLALLKTVFNDPRQLNRGDSMLEQTMSSLRGLRAPAVSAEPVTPGASDAARELLAKLYSVSGKQALSGVEFGQAAQPYTTASFREFFQRSPAIYAYEAASAAAPGQTPEATLQAGIERTVREAKAGSIISLSWKPARPSDLDGAQADQSARTPLSDFEWNELLTPGTHLHQRWEAQVDRLAVALQPLQTAGIPVLWRPYPEINVKKFWWGGRKGATGAPALYRMLFERLTQHAGLKNLIWVWTAAPDMNSEVPGSQFHDFLPGHLFFDAIAIAFDPSGQAGRRRPPIDRLLAHSGAGKPAGIELTAPMLRPETFAREPGLAWFIVTAIERPGVPAVAAPKVESSGSDSTTHNRSGTGAAPAASTPPWATAPTPEQSASELRTLLASPEVISLAPARM